MNNSTAMPWFRFYREALNNPKVQALEGEVFKSWINILCIAAGNNGSVSLNELPFLLRRDAAVTDAHLSALTEAGLLVRYPKTATPKDWEIYQRKSDTSTERTKRYRDNMRNATRDVTVTAQIRDREEEDKEKKEKETFQVSKKHNFESYKTAFDEFWQHYPKKRAGAKDKAAKAFYKAIDRTQCTPEDIIHGCMAYAASDEATREHAKYAKGAVAWLNDDRWKNEYSGKETSNAKRSWGQLGDEYDKAFGQGSDAEEMHHQTPDRGVFDSGLLLEAPGRPTGDGEGLLPLPKPVHAGRG